MKLPHSLLTSAANLALKAPPLSKLVLGTTLRVLGKPNLSRFVRYVIDFERAYVTDDWDDIQPYFAPDAVYEVTNVPFAARLEGAEEVVRGIRICLDGFDRRLERKLWIVEGPHEIDDRVTFQWRGAYSRPGEPPMRLAARQTARYRDSLIVELRDDYDPGVHETVEEWFAQYGEGVTASYV